MTNRQDYNKISKYYKETGAYIYITRNDEDDLVVIDAEERDGILKLSYELFKIRSEREGGAKYYTLKELNESMQQTIKDIANQKPPNEY